MVCRACDSPALTTRAPQLSAEALEAPGSPSLLSERRIACLSPYGIHLLQQRFINYANFEARGLLLTSTPPSPAAPIPKKDEGSKSG